MLTFGFHGVNPSNADMMARREQMRTVTPHGNSFDLNQICVGIWALRANKELKWMHLLCATHSLALSAQISTI